MKFHEAMKLLEEGKKVRNVKWKPQFFLSLDQEKECGHMGMLLFENLNGKFSKSQSGFYPKKKCL